MDERSVAAEAFATAARNHLRGIPAAVSAPPLLAVVVAGGLTAPGARSWMTVALLVSVAHNLLPALATRQPAGGRRRLAMTGVLLAAAGEGAVYGVMIPWLHVATRSGVMVAVLALALVLFGNAIYAAPAPTMLIMFHGGALATMVPVALTLPQDRVLVLIGLVMMSLAVGVNVHGLWRTVTRNIELSRRNQRLADELAGANRELHSAMGAIERMAATDELTGACSRRAFLAELDRRIEAAEPLVLALLDVDHFKQVNDRHGHGIGDEVLAGVVTTVQSVLRPEDLLGRVGGEEFGIVLAGSSLDAALALLERVRAAVAETGGGRPPVTVSLGVAPGAPGSDRTRLFSAADQALYVAKRQGRDRVVLHDPAVPPHRQGRQPGGGSSPTSPSTDSRITSA
jgi:diguanylate cyclase (GGDEF)-like protein